LRRLASSRILNMFFLTNEVLNESMYGWSTDRDASPHG
jgi:hypothetical protein